MGYDLLGSNDSIYLNIWNWPRMLQLAVRHGWVPAGTEPSAEDLFHAVGEGYERLDPETARAITGWDGNYFSNAGQLVGKEDARAFAVALELAIPRVSNELPELFRGRDTIPMDEFVPFWERVTPEEYFGGHRVKLVRMCSRFCRKGAFIIT